MLKIQKLRKAMMIDITELRWYELIPFFIFHIIYMQKFRETVPSSFISSQIVMKQ